jgi:hypothetical protein
VELPTTCTIAEARASITEQLQQQLPNQPQAVVLLWRDDKPGGDDRNTLITAAADDEEVNARMMDPDRPSFNHKMLLVCWLPKVRKGQAAHTAICRTFTQLRLPCHRMHGKHLMAELQALGTGRITIAARGMRLTLQLCTLF